MNIHATTATNPATGAASSGSSSGSSSLLNQTQNEFIQLLAAQLQNQSPLDPVDPTTFTSQLVQFNMLDELTQINNTLSTAYPAASGTSAGTTTGNPTGSAVHSATGAN